MTWFSSQNLFTVPSAGLRKRDDDPKKELPFNGVYLLKDGQLQLLDKMFRTPNGIAFSPDEKYLYVNDPIRKLFMRYDVRPDDTIANGKVFIDVTANKPPGVPDGMKVGIIRLNITRSTHQRGPMRTISDFSAI